MEGGELLKIGNIVPAYAHFPLHDGEKCDEKSSLGMDGKNGEKPKIQITESVKIGIHSTVFSVGESPNLKPNCELRPLIERNKERDRNLLKQAILIQRLL